MAIFIHNIGSIKGLLYFCTFLLQLLLALGFLEYPHSLVHAACPNGPVTPRHYKPDSNCGRSSTIPCSGSYYRQVTSVLDYESLFSAYQRPNKLSLPLIPLINSIVFPPLAIGYTLQHHLSHSMDYLPIRVDQRPFVSYWDASLTTWELYHDEIPF